MLETNDEISDQRFAELESGANSTNQELHELEEAFNSTSDIVEIHDTNIEGIIIWKRVGDILLFIILFPIYLNLQLEIIASY